MTNQINTKLLQKTNGKKVLIWDFDGVLCYLNYPKGKNFDIWWNELGSVLKEFDKNIINKTDKIRGLQYKNLFSIILNFKKYILT